MSSLLSEHPAGEATSTDNILVCTDVSCHYGGVAAVKEMSLAVPRSTTVGLIGPNGAGKSTLLNAIAGVTEVSRGRIYFENEDITELPPYAVALKGAIRTFQASSEFSRLTVLENLLAAERYASETSIWRSVFHRRGWFETERASVERARGYLARFGIAELENEYAGSLSGGQKRLLELARALMARPKILLLDEPTAGIAAPMVALLVHHLRELAAEGLSILLVEHDLDVIESLCDTIVVMAVGQKIAEGTIEEIRANEQVVKAYLN